MSDAWASRMLGLLKTAADDLNVDLIAQPVMGSRGRTVGCRVTPGEVEPQWLRVVTEPAGWGAGQRGRATSTRPP
jgi:hypothetical protein